MYLGSCIYKAELWFEVQVSLMVFTVVSNFILLSWRIQFDNEYIYIPLNRRSHNIISILSERMLRTPVFGDTYYASLMKASTVII